MKQTKKIIAFFLFFLIILVFSYGCTSHQQAQSNSEKSDEGSATAQGTAPDKESGSLVDTSETGVFRTIEKQGDNLLVTLHVNLPQKSRFYFFEETIPENAELLDTDIESSGKSLKQVVIGDSKSTKYSYTIKPGQAETIFSGSYAIDGMENPKPIKGETVISE